MPKVTLNLERQEIADILAQLTPEDLDKLIQQVQSRKETKLMSGMAESSFSEWLEEEDLYGNG